MKRFHTISALVFIGLSILHTIVGFMNSKPISENTFWFFSAGMSLLYVGLINLIQTSHYNDKMIRIISIISNLVMTVFVITFGIYTLDRNIGNPLAWLLIFNAVGALILSILSRTNAKVPF